MNAHLRKLLAGFMAVGISTLAGFAALTIDFNYDNTSGFFSTEVKATLATAASDLIGQMQDNLTAIVPSGGNTWNAKYWDPANMSSQLTWSNPSIASDHVVIYMGAFDMGASILGQGGPGWVGSASGTQPFLDNAVARGQTGALAAQPTDFGPWGGSIAFNSAMSWSTGMGAPAASTSDFYSVAVHELAHVLGFGTANSWSTYQSGSVFTGANSVSVHGANVPLSGDLSHWANSTTSFLLVNGNLQETAMDPDLNGGTRKYFTALDYAGMKDIGWDIAVVPEPAAMASLAGIGLLLFAAYRKRGSFRP